MTWPLKLLLLWTVAIALHLPIPVGEFVPAGLSLPAENGRVAGQADQSQQARRGGPTASPRSSSERPRWIFSVVFLGCDVPDDGDPGPVDDDPENVFGMLFGSFVVSSQPTTLVWAVTPRVDWTEAITSDRVAATLLVIRKPQISGHSSRLHASFGKCCQSGIAVFRC